MNTSVADYKFVIVTQTLNDGVVSQSAIASQIDAVQKNLLCNSARASVFYL